MGKTNSAKTEALKKSLNVADKLKEVSENILNGMPEAQACRTANIELSAYRRFLFSENMGFRMPELPKLDDREHILFSPEEYIYADIIKCKKRKDENTGLEIVNLKPSTYIPPDLKDTIPVLLNYLNEREQRVMKMRYYEGLSYEKIGKEEGKTREWTRQIIERVLEKFRTPSYMNYLLYANKQKEYERRGYKQAEVV